MLYILTSVWVLHTPNAGRNDHFQRFYIIFYHIYLYFKTLILKFLVKMKCTNIITTTNMTKFSYISVIFTHSCSSSWSFGQVPTLRFVLVNFIRSNSNWFLVILIRSSELASTSCQTLNLLPVYAPVLNLQRYLNSSFSGSTWGPRSSGRKSLAYIDRVPYFH